MPINRMEKVDLQSTHKECLDLFAYFNSKIIEALTKTMKISLELLKKRETATSVLEMAVYPPLVKTDMELHIPNAIIVPSLEEIQGYFTNIMQNTLDVMNAVSIWAQRDFDNMENDDGKSL